MNRLAVGSGLLLALALLSGCGAKSGLDPTEQEPVTCPATALKVLAGRETRVEVPGAAALRGYYHEWALVSRPSGGAPSLRDGAGGALLFTADVTGAYDLHYEARNFLGDSQACDVRVEVTTAPIVTCAATPATADQNGMATLEAHIVSTSTPTVEWSVIDGPEAGGAAVTPSATLGEARFEAALPGEYRVRVDVASAEGTDSCELVVTVPDDNRLRAVCPSTLVVSPLEPVELVGDAYRAAEPMFTWSLVAVPVGSAVTHESAPGRAVSITPDIVGNYLLELLVTDENGEEDTCRTTVRAVTQEGLRVEMFWLEDESDMDVHVLHPDGTRWFHPVWDCYWSSCKRHELSWFDPGQADDPNLDIDDRDGFGPENINIPEPRPGTYRVAVHAYERPADWLSNELDATATVRIYCGVGSTTPVWESEPTVLAIDEAFWWVADVTVGPRGCSVDPLGEIGTRLESEDRR